MVETFRIISIQTLKEKTQFLISQIPPRINTQGVDANILKNVSTVPQLHEVFTSVILKFGEIYKLLNSNERE